MGVVLQEIVPTRYIPLIGGQKHDLLGGKVWTALVFYPGDFTPVCTRQWCDYREQHQAFESRGVKLIGVSVGPGKRHQDFAKSYQLPFEFAEDEDQRLITEFGMKSRLGYVKRGIALISPDGVLRYCKSHSLPLTYPSVEQILKMVPVPS